MNLSPANRFALVENGNRVVNMCKSLRFSLVGIAGLDLVDGNRTATLAVVWQLMRYHALAILKSLRSDGAGAVTDRAILKWALVTVQSAGKRSSIRNFRDKEIGTGVFLLDLLAAVDPKTVNFDYVTAGETAEDKEANARYLLSVARLQGSAVFLSWADIVEVKSRMVLLFVAAVWANTSN